MTRTVGPFLDDLECRWEVAWCKLQIISARKWHQGERLGTGWYSARTEGTRWNDGEPPGTRDRRAMEVSAFTGLRQDR
jgi:hypothetical protein